MRAEPSNSPDRLACMVEGYCGGAVVERAGVGGAGHLLHWCWLPLRDPSPPHLAVAQPCTSASSRLEGFFNFGVRVQLPSGTVGLGPCCSAGGVDGSDRPMGKFLGAFTPAGSAAVSSAATALHQELDALDADMDSESNSVPCYLEPDKEWELNLGSRRVLNLQIGSPVWL